jgi:hypothetical protein
MRNEGGDCGRKKGRKEGREGGRGKKEKRRMLWKKIQWVCGALLQEILESMR